MGKKEEMASTPRWPAVALATLCLTLYLGFTIPVKVGSVDPTTTPVNAILTLVLSFLAEVFVVGLSMVVVGFVGTNLTPHSLRMEYDNPKLFRQWREYTAPYMLLHPFIIAPSLLAAFDWLSSLTSPSFPSPSDVASLGIVLLIVASLPAYSVLYASFNVSPTLACVWAAQASLQLFAGLYVVMAWRT